jgi:hypothetical protein
MHPSTPPPESKLSYNLKGPRLTHLLPELARTSFSHFPSPSVETTVQKCTKSWSPKAPWCSHLSSRRTATPTYGDLIRTSGNRSGGSRGSLVLLQRPRSPGSIHTCESFWSSVNSFLTFTTPIRMTFIGGGRACIGFKFSQLEMSKPQVPLPPLHAPLTMFHTNCLQRSSFAYFWTSSNSLQQRERRSSGG